jgi:hypothetical protein
MAWNKKAKNRLHYYLSITLLLTGFLLNSCSVSYRFEGGTINYDLIKTISIAEFPNRAALVNPLLSQMLDQELVDRFINQTRLRQVSNNGDIDITGEITGYNIVGVAVTEDAYASRSKLTITVRVNYENHKEPKLSVDRTFSAERETDTLDGGNEDALCQEICKELVDMIYNETVASW